LATSRDLDTAARVRQIVSEKSGDLFDLARDAIIVRDLAQGTILFWNSGAEALYGWKREDDAERSLARAQSPR
jgi:PAS domain-containing protein